jgi:ABC-type nickel/cobalt efflux system permease component RcnA
MRVASLSPEHTPAFTITAPSVIYPELHARRYANTAGQDSGGHDQVRDDDHSHDQSAHAVTHRHGSGPLHTHTVPGADGQGVTARNLLALGVSGGLLPCPSALVVLLAAISFGNIALGMALVAAFSVGLAGVLTGLGLLVVFGGRALGRFPVVARLGASPLAGALPVVSAAIITVAGIGITLQAVGAWV